MDREFGLEDPEVVMLLATLKKILGHDNRGESPYGNLFDGRLRTTRSTRPLKHGALSGNDLANLFGEPRTYQPCEMPLPTTPKPGLRRMHPKMSSKAASSSSKLRAAVPPKGTRVEEEVQTNETLEDTSEKEDQLERVKEELARKQQDWGLWRRLFEDANRRQEEERARLKGEHTERSERLKHSDLEKPERDGFP